MTPVRSVEPFDSDLPMTGAPPITPSAAPQQQGVNLRVLLEEMIERGASDLHITAGERAKMRIDGEITNSLKTAIPAAR